MAAEEPLNGMDSTEAFETFGNPPRRAKNLSGVRAEQSDMGLSATC